MHFPWNRMERELEAELAHHLYHLTAEYERQGYPHSEALKMAKRTFGGSEQLKDECRDESRWAGITGILQDLRFGARMMRSTPVITVAVVLSLALGIGANTAIISLMDVVLWRDLPIPEPKQLDLVHWQGKDFPSDLADAAAGDMWQQGGVNVADFFSFPAYELMRKGVRDMASISAYTFPSTVSVSFAGRATVAQARPVSANFFSTLRVRAGLGRLFVESDDREPAPPTVVLSHRFWSSTLQSDPTVIGKTISINNKAHIIAGVLTAGFYGLDPGDSTEIYAPFRYGVRFEGPELQSGLMNNRLWMCSMLARRKEGVRATQLQSALETLFRASWAKRPKDAAAAPHIRLDEGRQGLGSLRREFEDPLLVLGGLVSLLLVIACTNIANLLLARAVARRREVMVRVSLGCSRGRLVRQFVTESALLAGSGGLLSVGVSYLTANLLGRFLAERDSLPVAVALDFRVLLIVGAVTMLALLLFGIFPAFQGSRIARVITNRPGLGGLGNGAMRSWSAGRVLVVAQVAMSVILVLAAVIFTRNLLSIQSADPGFDRRNLVLFTIRPGTSGYEKSRLPDFYFNLEQRLLATSGVSAVGMAWMRPMNVGGWWQQVVLPGKTDRVEASVNGVTASYLPVFVGRLVAGRNLTRSDIESKAKVAVISEDLAKKFGGGPALGKFFEFGGGRPGGKRDRYEIVGIAPAIAATSMKDRPAAVWLPIDPEVPQVTVVVRTSRPPQLVLSAIRQTMRNVDRNLPLYDVLTMQEQIAKTLQRERMFAILCTAFGALALVLSVVGLYGVISYNASRRRGEIGVRLALGALPRNVLTMILREGLSLTMLGILLAAPVVMLGARYIEKLLLHMKPLEPASIGLAVGVLITAALIAVTLPAMRAAGVNPSEALREE